MGAALSLCIVDDSWEPEEVFVQKILKRYLDNGEAKLALAVASLPHAPKGASRSLFAPSDRISEVWIETLQVVKGWAPLKWRFRASAVPAVPAMEDRRQMMTGPSQRFWRAKVIVTLSNGEERTQWCLLQVAMAPENRTIENAMIDRKDAERVAAYAGAFNQHMLKDEAHADAGYHEGCMPRVSVCIPVVCKVLQSPVPQFFARGDAVLLLPFSAAEVTKFIYDGKEDFLEIPHSFFHYITWSSGGRDCISDLQGAEEDNGSVVLVSPCVPRQITFGSGIFEHTGTGEGIAQRVPEQSPQMFDRLHPRCGPLCKTFDPDRRARPMRKHCGLPMSCGLQSDVHSSCRTEHASAPRPQALRSPNARSQ